MENCLIHTTNLGLYEEPTTYKHDYVHHPQSSEEKIPAVAQISIPVNDEKYLDVSQQKIRAHDTLQSLNYNKRIPFTTFLEHKDSVSVSVQPLLRQQILGDKQHQEVRRSRPRVYMTPGISLDDIENSETRKLLLNFTYMTMSNYTSKNVWHDFQPKRPCHNEIDKNTKETCEKSMQKSPCILSTRFQTEAYMWDKLQDRSLSVDDIFVSKYDRSKINQEYSDSKAEKENNQIKVKNLLEKDKLRKAYDNFPLTYSGYRPHTGLGIPLEKKILPVVHPDLSVTQALYQRYADSSTS